MRRRGVNPDGKLRCCRGATDTKMIGFLIEQPPRTRADEPPGGARSQRDGGVTGINNIGSFNKWVAEKPAAAGRPGPGRDPDRGSGLGPKNPNVVTQTNKDSADADWKVPFICCLVFPFLVLPPLTPALAAAPAPPMSSKRGRKRNDNLPPNRARDVQRAFRARRAAHLQVRHLLSSSVILFAIISIFCRVTSRLSRCASASSRRRTAVCVPPSTCPRPTVPPSARAPRARTSPSRSTTSP